MSEELIAAVRRTAELTLLSLQAMGDTIEKEFSTYIEIWYDLQEIRLKLEMNDSEFNALIAAIDELGLSKNKVKTMLYFLNLITPPRRTEHRDDALVSDYK
jgi:hypothetical protein